MFRFHAVTLLALSLVGPSANAAGTPAAPASGDGAKLAAPEPTSSNLYAVSLLTTTLAYRPPGGRIDGPQGDVTPSVGIGRYLTPSLAIEVDGAVTFTRDGYASTSVVPGALWIFHPNAYVAARVIVPVHPTPNVVLSPGIGAFLPIRRSVAFVAELDAVSAVAGGTAPDLGLGMTAGLFYSL